ncbi:hypothetical protein TNCV_4604131 [Trichonephila clavipes]|nr:hypothetical protein TNCV_4604131 [Trichonephila clavipes]
MTYGGGAEPPFPHPFLFVYAIYTGRTATPLKKLEVARTMEKSAHPWCKALENVTVLMGVSIPASESLFIDSDKSTISSTSGA